MQKAYLYTLRLWKEELGDGDIEFRGQLQDVNSHESYYFRNWQSLLRLLGRMLPYPAELPDVESLPTRTGSSDDATSRCS